MFTLAARFVASGATNTALTLILYWFLLRFVDPHIAYATSFLAGLALSYALNLRFVFRGRHTNRKILLFPLVYLLTYAIGALVLHISINTWRWNPTLAPLASIACTIPVSFVLLRGLLSDSKRI